MAGRQPTGRCVCELGQATHKYWYGSGVYFRQPLANKTIGAIEFWTGSEWAKALNLGANTAEGEPSLPNTDSIAPTP